MQRFLTLKSPACWHQNSHVVQQHAMIVTRNKMGEWACHGLPNHRQERMTGIIFSQSVAVWDFDFEWHNFGPIETQPWIGETRRDFLVNLASRPLLKDTILSAQGSSVAKVSHNTCRKQLSAFSSMRLEMVNGTSVIFKTRLLRCTV